MTEQEIISKTKAILNEIGEEDNFSLLSEDTVKMEEYIKSVIPDAVGIVQMNSPVRCINKKSGASVNQTLSPVDGKCIVIIPEDFVSLIAIKLACWKRVCITSYGMDSEEYRRQCNPATMAGAYKPVCINGYDGLTGKRVLMLYSSKADTKLDMFFYEAKYTHGAGIDIDPNESVASAICYMAASLVYSIFENKDAAQEMRTIALNLIPKQ